MVALNKSKSKGKDTTALVTVPESDLSKDAQARMSSALSQANVQTNDKVQSDRLDEEEAQTNRLIAAATECAEALAGHEEFNAFTHDAIEHKREEDYKSVRCYKYMQAYLSHDQRALLPWPKSKHDDAFVKTSNTPNVYDVIKTKRKNAKGEIVSHTTSYYRTMAEALPEGVTARDTLLAIEKVEGNTIDAPQEWKTDKQGNSIGKPRLEAAKGDCRRTLNTLTDAMRKAGHIILQEHAISALPRVRMTWTTDEQGLIVRSTKSLSLVSRRPDKAGTVDEYDLNSIKSFSIGQMLSWKVDKAKRVAPHNQITLDTLVASSKGVSKTTSKPPAGQTADSVFKVTNITDAEKRLNEFRAYAQGANPIEAQERYASLMSRAKDDDAALDTMRWVYDALAPHVNAPANVERVTKYREGLVKAKVA